jgi:hypothetical protein
MVLVCMLKENYYYYYYYYTVMVIITTTITTIYRCSMMLAAITYILYPLCDFQFQTRCPVKILNAFIISTILANNFLYARKFLVI